MDFSKSDEGEEETNLNLMADSVECSLHDSNDEVDFTDLHFFIKASNELLSNSSKLSKAFQLARKQNKKLSKENDIFKK